jgi:SulP family sulfate permease
MPLPVIGGYLAYIGLFCLYAGLSLSSGLAIHDLSTALQLLQSPSHVLLCVPSIFFGMLFYLVSYLSSTTYASHAYATFALPLVIATTPLWFYLVLYFGFSASLEDARTYGWVAPRLVQENNTDDHIITSILSLFSFSRVHWHVMLGQIPTWISMTIVVAISSALDVAAIETDMMKLKVPRQQSRRSTPSQTKDEYDTTTMSTSSSTFTSSSLNVNQELTSVGWSNLVSGLLGGYTGSYIFSMTIFTFRSRTFSRVVGVTVLLCELAMVLLPLPLTSVMPRYFFAATLIFVAIDLLVEWLVLVVPKVLSYEYMILWFTFVMIQFANLPYGLLLGLGVAILHFVWTYVHASHVLKMPVPRDMARVGDGMSAQRQTRSALDVRELPKSQSQNHTGILVLEIHG